MGQSLSYLQLLPAYSFWRGVLLGSRRVGNNIRHSLLIQQLQSNILFQQQYIVKVDEYYSQIEHSFYTLK
ncbi:hypothetical protein pb186bvf_020370 [Paramecium bursaria]